MLGREAFPMVHRLVVLALTGALTLASAGAAPAQTVTLGMANEYPATSIQGEADARFAREVAVRTGGRIEIAHQYDASSAFRSKDMVDAAGRPLTPGSPRSMLPTWPA
jgi:TRAP-type C4-dicarboxylate transport system substrate-binding protein